MYSSAYVWAKVLSHMEERLGAVTVSAWFDDAEVVELNENNLILYSPSDFRREIIRRRCTDYVQDALKEVFNSDAKLLVFGDEERDTYHTEGEKLPPRPWTSIPSSPSTTSWSAPPTGSPTPRPSPFPRPRDRCTIPCSSMALAGVGKTHLLYAIANGIRKQKP